MPNPKVVLVTGASSGIGEAIAARLARDGHRVFGTSRKAREAREGIELLPLDVCSDASVQSCVERLLREVGRIDVLVNNAGYLLSGAIEEATLEEARAQLETNFFGVVRMVKAVLPGMRQARQGHIVTISSLAGLVPVRPWASSPGRPRGRRSSPRWWPAWWRARTRRCEAASPGRPRCSRSSAGCCQPPRSRPARGRASTWIARDSEPVGGRAATHGRMSIRLT
jgi:NAD(P)-dependent dehydrogenase (short-subunit alcohol dehydrogenase family)